jgi:hypothetical protein
MSARAHASEPDLRGEIEYLLQNRAPDFERGEHVATAWTVPAIATELGASRKAVALELRKLRTEGRVTIRIMKRTGEVLWKLTDDLHDKWQAFAGPVIIIYY